MELEGISLVSLTLSFKATKWSVSGYAVVLELQMKDFFKKSNPQLSKFSRKPYF